MRGKYFYYPDYKDRETDEQRVKQLVQIKQLVSRRAASLFDRGQRPEEETGLSQHGFFLELHMGFHSTAVASTGQCR